MKRQPTYIFGTHAVTEALTYKPEAVLSVLFDTSASTQEDILRLAKKHLIKTGTFVTHNPPKPLERGIVHQGVIAEVNPDALVISYEEFVKDLEVTPDSSLVLLGEVQDPQNVGSIIRSAAAFGFAGVLLPQFNQAQVTGTVVKVSVGMAFRIPLVQIGNVNTTIKDLKERGFWSYGLDGDSKTKIADEDFSAASLFVVGNEGAGIRNKTKDACDILLSIPMNNRCESLNAGTSTAIALYEWSRRHPRSLRG